MKKSCLFYFLIYLVFCGNLLAVTVEEGIKDPDLNKAWQWVQTDQPDKALRFLSQKGPGSSDPFYYHFILGKAFESRKIKEEALIHFRSAYFQAPSDDLKALALLERGETYYRTQNYYEAKIVFTIFLKFFSQSNQIPRACLGLARSLAKIGSWKEALYYFEKAGEGPAAIFGKADTLHLLGQVNEAHQVYQKGIAGYKTYFLESSEHLFYYGENLYQMGNEKEALSLLGASMSDPLLRKRADLVLGQMAIKNRQGEEAIKLLRSSLSSPETAILQEALFYLAEAFALTGNKTQARQTLEEYWSKYPAGKSYNEVLIRLAQIDLAEGRLDQAERWIKELGFRSPLPEKILKEMEWFLLKLKEKNPSRMISLWKCIGHNLLQSSREPFLLIMTSALKGTGKPYFNLLQWLSQNGSVPVKIKSLTALVQRQIEAGSMVAAAEGIQKLKGLKGAVNEILRLEARISYAKKDYGTASDRLLSINKITAEDLILLQETLSFARDHNKALAVFEKNLVRLGGNSQSYIKLADLYYGSGKTKEALHYYQKSLELDPLNEWALYQTGILTGGEEGRRILSRIKNEASIVGKFAKAESKTIEIQRKIGESF